MEIERDIQMNLNWLRFGTYDRDRAYSFVQKRIGEYRLEAERQFGFVRRYIHRQANVLERKLEDAFLGREHF